MKNTSKILTTGAIIGTIGFTGATTHAFADELDGTPSHEQGVDQSDVGNAVPSDDASTSENPSVNGNDNSNSADGEGTMPGNDGTSNEDTPGVDDAPAADDGGNDNSGDIPEATPP